jgi:hypothetical protein
MHLQIFGDLLASAYWVLETLLDKLQEYWRPCGLLGNANRVVETVRENYKYVKVETC